jgi:hypothetical protein
MDKDIREKKYRLLKDLPDLQAGAVFFWDNENNRFANDIYSSEGYLFAYHIMEDIEWFEEIFS